MSCYYCFFCLVPNWLQVKGRSEKVLVGEMVNAFLGWAGRGRYYHYARGHAGICGGNDQCCLFSLRGATIIDVSGLGCAWRLRSS